MAKAEKEGFGCASILVTAAIIWALVAVFTDIQLGCCSAIVLVLAIVVLYRIFGGR
jgi:hypothetical protein